MKAPAQSPFETLPNGNKLQFAWDATSLSTFKACPRKFYYTQMLSLRGKERAAPLVFGGHLHDALERYERALHAGVPFNDAVRDTVIYLLKVTTTRVKFVNQETKKEEERLIFWTTDDTTRTRETLVRAFVWYTEQFRNDPLKAYILANGKPALELSFRLELPLKTPNGNPYLWCGHIDKVAELQGNLYIQERKHTKQTLAPSYFDKYSPNTQVTGYIFSAAVILQRPVGGAFIDAAQTAVSFSRYARGMQNRTQDQISEWYRGTLYWIKQAEACAVDNFWPMNEESCSNFGGCPFRSVCSKDPKVRKNFLDSDFEHRAWNPLEDREVL